MSSRRAPRYQCGDSLVPTQWRMPTDVDELGGAVGAHKPMWIRSRNVSGSHSNGSSSSQTWDLAQRQWGSHQFVPQTSTSCRWGLQGRAPPSCPMCASLHRRGAPTRGAPGGEEIDGGGGPPGGVLHVGGTATHGTEASPRQRSWARGEVLAVWQLVAQKMAVKPKKGWGGGFK
jgi:hypothetical protein